MALLKIVISLSLSFNPIFTSSARAQENPVGLSEVVHSISKSPTYGDLLAVMKDRVQPQFYSYFEKKIAKFSGLALPIVIEKSRNEFEVSIGGIIAVVKVPEPYRGVMVVNNREIEIDPAQSPETLYENIRKAFPRKQAALIFDFLIPQVFAAGDQKDVAPLRVAPPTTTGVQVPAGALGTVKPGYTPAGALPAQPTVPAIKAAAPPAKSPSMALPMLLGVVAMVAAMLGGNKECKDVDSRNDRCDKTERKISAGKGSDDDVSEARKLASENRSGSGTNKCSGARDKLNDCMAALKLAASRRLGENIGDVEPPKAKAGGRY